MIATTTANAERVPVHEWEILNVSILSRLYIQIPYNTGIGTEHDKYGKLMRFETVMDGEWQNAITGVDVKVSDRNCELNAECCWLVDKHGKAI